MKALTMTVEHSAAVIRRLQHIEETLATDILRKAGEFGAEVLRQRMADNAPLGDEAPHLAQNVVVEAVDPGEPRAASWLIGPASPFFYGYYLEFGTRRMAAQPFARPAFDTHSGAALAETADHIAAELRQFEHHD